MSRKRRVARQLLGRVDRPVPRSVMRGTHVPLSRVPRPGRTAARPTQENS